MTTAREIMTGGVECARTTDTVQDAARKMKELGVGALPICGEDERLAGMITDRDIVLTCVADGHDVTQMTVEEYAGDEVVTIGADWSACARSMPARAASPCAASSGNSALRYWVPMSLPCRLSVVGSCVAKWTSSRSS